jgi:hypothetical protein
MNNLFCKLIYSAISILIANASLADSKNGKYVQLPNGSYYQAKEGQTLQQALRDANQSYPEAFGNVRVPKQKIMDLDWYNECKLKAATTSSASIQAAVQACEYKAVPKKCRIHNVEKDALGNESADARIQCVEECSKANYYSKSLGECSRG